MQASDKPRGLAVFAGVLVGLIALDVLFASVALPPAVAPYASVIVAALFVAAPVWALYHASREAWTWQRAAALIVIGVGAHIGTLLLMRPAVTPGQFVAMQALAGVTQAALLTWCLGLGAMLACLMRDRNLLLPVAIFLAAFDIFVILTPGGPTKHLMEAHPAFFEHIAYGIPKVAQGRVDVGSALTARIGPADFFLIGMFFIALTRFGMRTTATLRAVVPVLIGYMLVVMLWGAYRIGPMKLEALPALVPIGMVVLFVNRKEFTMTKEEKASTVIVALLGLGLIVYGATRAPSHTAPIGSPTSAHALRTP